MRTCTLTVLALLLLLPAAPWARADDKEKAGADDLVTKIFDVGALTQGRYEFHRELSQHVDYEMSEENPLFGSEETEPIFVVGQVDELIELVKMNVQPASWERTLGAGIRGMGESTLIVRAFPDVVEGVASYLAQLQRRVSRRVIVDVESYRLSRARVRDLLQPGSNQLADPAKVAAVRGSRAAGPSVSLLAFERVLSAIYAGRQRAYVGDYDAEVAEKSSGGDPIVSVANMGLSIDMRCTLSPDGSSAVLVVDGALSELLENRTVDAGESMRIELPDHAVAGILSRVEVPVGTWAVIDGQSQEGEDRRWTFLVRVRGVKDEGLARTARSVTLQSPSARPARRFELRTIDIGALQEASPMRSGENLFLVPSNYTPPEPPELPEPYPLFPQEALVELIREAVVPGSWEVRGTGIEAFNGYLHVRNSKDVLDAIDVNVARIRREFLWSLVTESEVVDVPSSLAHQLGAAPGAILDEAGRKALEAAIEAGQASHLGTVRVMNMRGGRNAVLSGRRISYLSDYEIEIAKETLIGNPVIQSLLSGAGLDVEPKLTVGGDAVQMNMRFVRTKAKMPLRKMPTPYGEVDVPELGVFRVRAATRAPLGKTMIVASAGGEGRHQLLLVSSSLRRRTGK